MPQIWTHFILFCHFHSAVRAAERARMESRVLSVTDVRSCSRWKCWSCRRKGKPAAADLRSYFISSNLHSAPWPPWPYADLVKRYKLVRAAARTLVKTSDADEVRFSWKRRIKGYKVAQGWAAAVSRQPKEDVTAPPPDLLPLGPPEH